MDTGYHIAEFLNYHNLLMKEAKIEFSEVLEAFSNISSHGKCIQIDAKQVGYKD